MFRLAVLFLLPLGLVAKDISGCTGAGLSELKVGEQCKSPWSKLRTALLPTQPDVGVAHVRDVYERHFIDHESAIKWFGKNTFPVVFGPAGSLYLTDRHHHIAALEWSNDAKLWNLDITVDLIADLRNASNMTDFWAKMKAAHHVFLYTSASSPFDLPKLIEPSGLPLRWTMGGIGLGDSIWRALAGFADTIDDSNSRCYVKECTAFVDFEWAYLMNAATISANGLWDSVEHGEAFLSELKSQPYPSDLSTVNTTIWKTFGVTLSAQLCHEAGVPSFKLPDGFPRSTLQGWVAKRQTVPPNPDCSQSGLQLSTLIV